MHDAGEDVAVFGPGRPKKEQTVSSAEQTLQKIDETLSDNEKDSEIKEESAPFQLPDCAVPKVVIGLCNERIASINRQIQVYVEQVDLLNNERNELLEFIEKGERNEKNGVHGEV